MSENYFKGFKETMIDTGDASIKVVYGGVGEPVLMLHGHPETHLMWHRVAPELAKHYTLVMTDLRGYGESSHPAGLPDHSNYSRRAMGDDQAKVMEKLGYRTYYLVGHDRGARVAHRMLLDYPERIRKCMILDIVPTYDIYEQMNSACAKAFFHWFFLIQENGLPERLLAGSREEFVRTFLGQYDDPENSERVFPEEIKKEYVKYLATPEGIHSICEDYRACATIDLEHDRKDRDRVIQTPIQVLFAEDGNMNKFFDVLKEWKKRGSDVSGFCVPHCGHHIPEDAPEVTIKAIEDFFQ